MKVAPKERDELLVSDVPLGSAVSEKLPSVQKTTEAPMPEAPEAAGAGRSGQ